MEECRSQAATVGESSSVPDTRFRACSSQLTPNAVVWCGRWQLRVARQRRPFVFETERILERALMAPCKMCLKSIARCHSGSLSGLIDFAAVILEMSVVEKERAVSGEKGANLAPKKSQWWGRRRAGTLRRKWHLDLSFESCCLLCILGINTPYLG